jgi:hypothetical protein
MAFNLYTKHTNNDYRFFDRVIKEQFQVGGTIVYVHKYLGPGENHDPSALEPDYLNGSTEKDIGDYLFLQNPRRRYSADVYELFCHYPIQDTSFDLMQFGLALSGSDTIYVTTHINDMNTRLGRKLMSGDVLEFAHLRDYDLLDPDSAPINRFFVVQDGDRPAEGFSPTWRPHIWRVRAIPLVDAPEFKDIMRKINKTPSGPGLGSASSEQTFGDILSTRDKELFVMDQLLAQAKEEVPFMQPDQHHLWIDINEDGKIVLFDERKIGTVPGDGTPPNQNYDDVESGSIFPSSPSDKDYYLRLDYSPPRLFQYDNSVGVWRYQESDFRREWSPASELHTDMVNNSATIIGADGETFKSRLGLTDVLKAREDLGKKWNEDE